MPFGNQSREALMAQTIEVAVAGRRLDLTGPRRARVRPLMVGTPTRARPARCPAVASGTGAQYHPAQVAHGGRGVKVGERDDEVWERVAAGR